MNQNAEFRNRTTDIKTTYKNLKYDPVSEEGLLNHDTV